jgi:hypothetical protein
MNPNNTDIILDGSEFQVKIPPEMWAELILFLSKRGWRPSFPTYFPMGRNLEVGKEDANSLASAGQSVLDEALYNPLAVYPVPFDMGKLAEIVCLCEEGAFRICR